MKITILAFGIAKEIFNSSSIELDVQEEITVAALKSILEIKYPKMSNLSSYMIALNNEYAEDDMVVHSVDEMAIIPPVSGG